MTSQPDVPLFDLPYGPEEEEAVRRVLESKWLTLGPVTEEFEAAFAAYVGSKHAVAVCNGTAALHLALAVVGTGPEDEVIVPSLTFVATANAVLYCGAAPVFADITGEHDLTILPGEIERKITDRTKAILVMHYGGYACDMARIMETAERHKLFVMEDAAHAPGAVCAMPQAPCPTEARGPWSVVHGPRRCGSLGDLGCFSFFSNKNLATGEGGMVVTNDGELAARLGTLRSHGMTTLTWQRHQGHAFSYDVTQLGYNYRPSEITSALGLAQLRKLEGFNASRRRLTRVYHQRLAEVPGVTLPFVGREAESACHILPVLLPESADRAKVMAGLREDGIQTSIHYPPIHQFSFYREHVLREPVHLPLTESVAQRELTLPLFPTMTEEQVERVVERLRARLVG